MGLIRTFSHLSRILKKAEKANLTQMTYKSELIQMETCSHNYITIFLYTVYTESPVDSTLVFLWHVHIKILTWNKMVQKRGHLRSNYT